MTSTLRDHPQAVTIPEDGETEPRPPEAPEASDTSVMPNGAAAAAILAASIGCLALGVAILATEFSPALKEAANIYSPVGPLAGKTTFMVVVWLVTWGVLHALWQTKQVALGKVFTISMVLLAVATLFNFPPFFTLFARH